MNYPLKSKPKHEQRGKVVTVFVSFIVLSLFVFLFSTFARTSSYTMAKPLWLVGDVVNSFFSYTKDYFISKNTLISRNQQLEDENATLRLREIDYNVLTAENEDLRSELGRTPSSSRIISRVLSKPPRSPYDTLVIDVGSSDGVILGSKVYLGESVIIGVVTNVTPRTSLVELFSSGNKKQEAILDRTGASFTLTGNGGANFQLEVPKDTDILWGDMFKYPTFSGSVIGSVYYIDTNSQSSFKTIYIRIPGNVFSSKYVFVE
jgi:cell shape-determining protein MreC